jgi:hypothetical protein
MGDNPVTLDFSKAQPLQGSAQPGSPGGVSLDFSKAQKLGQPAQAQPMSEQERYQKATDEGSLWRKVLLMNPDQGTLKKYGFDTDSYNAAERKYKEVSPGEIARGAPFDPSTQKITEPGSLTRGGIKAFSSNRSADSQLLGKAKRAATGESDQTKEDLITGEHHPTGIFGEAPEPDSATAPVGFGEHVGYIGENIMEFMAGDEALKALSLAEKFKLAGQVAKLAESHPAIAKLITMGLNATRTATVAGAQEAEHGGGTGDVLSAAGTGFLTHAASEGLPALAKLARPGTTQVAGEIMQTAPKWKGAGTAAKVAEANQGPAQQALGNIARDSADPLVQKLGQKAPETIMTFKDAADAVEGAAKPVFQKLDELSGGGFQAAKNELDSANKIIRRATSIEDLKGAEKAAEAAKGKIDQIFANAGGKVSAEDLQNARSAWRSKIVLEQLHSQIDKAFDMPQAASDISGASRTLDLTKLQGRLVTSFSKIPQQDLETVLGKEGTSNLFALAKLGADPARAKTLSAVAAQLGEKLGITGAGALAGAALGHAIPGGSAALGLHFLYSHPEAGALVARLMAQGASPKVVVPAVVQLLDSQRQQGR